MTARDRARGIVLKYGRNATTYQILNPGFEFWFSRDGNAVAGYVAHHGVRVVAGVPVCDLHELAAVAAEFEEDSHAAGCDVAYFAVEEPEVSVWQTDSRMRALVIGAQPVWRPATLAEIMTSHRSLRAQLNRAAAKNVRIEEWPAERARNSNALRTCLDEWLSRRSLPPLHFLVESETLPALLDRRVFVAVRDAAPIGFLVAAPMPQRDAWLVEQNVRGASAPNGTSESLLYAAAVALAADGADAITLGLSPLSNHAPLSSVEPPRLVRALFAWLRVHGRRFYNFEGLDNFKSKFRPEQWEPVYAVVPRGVGTWRALLAIGAAFGGTSAAPFLLRIMKHALGQELERVSHWRHQDATAN
jgi:phosphatidylglycerol lysyltransferase